MRVVFAVAGIVTAVLTIGAALAVLAMLSRAEILPPDCRTVSLVGDSRTWVSCEPPAFAPPTHVCFQEFQGGKVCLPIQSVVMEGAE